MMTRRQSGKRPRPEDNLQMVAERLRRLATARVGKLAPTIPAGQKQAAVLVPLFAREPATNKKGGGDGTDDVRGEVRVLLTKRSATLKSHQGEVCLPGGKRDPEDVDDVATALREANEELGLSPSSVEVIVCLPPLLSKHFLSVTPVVALIPEEREIHAPKPNADEVAEVFDVPLSIFLGTTGHSSQDVSWQGHTYRLHSFEYGDQTIWGLTAAILIQVAKHAHDCEPDFQEHARHGVAYNTLWHDGQRLRVHTLADSGAPDHAAVSASPQVAVQKETQGLVTVTAASSALDHDEEQPPDDVVRATRASWQHEQPSATTTASRGGPGHLDEDSQQQDGVDVPADEPHVMLPSVT